MSSPGITARVRDHLQRQIATYERCLSELAQLDMDLTKADLEALLRKGDERTLELDALEQEFWPLQQEWLDTDDIPDADRDEIDELARRAQTLLLRVLEGNAASAGRLNKAADETKDELGALHRGRGVVRKYKLGDDEGSGWVDRKA